MVWNAESGQPIWTSDSQQKDVNSVVFSPNGTRVVSGNNGGTIKAWNTETGEELVTFKNNFNRNDFVNSLAFSPDGNSVVSGGNLVQAWDANSGERIWTADTINAGRASCNSVAFSPDGNWVVSGKDDGLAQIWNAETGYKVLTFRGHYTASSVVFSTNADEGAVTCVAFSPDGKRIASGSWDRTVRLWNPKTGQEIISETDDYLDDWLSAPGGEA